MVLANRKGFRTVWIVAACLLGVVVVKLFIVDLGKLSVGARIISFLVVGGLLLLVGYFSPVPPAKKDPGASADEPPSPAQPGVAS
jgi:uncharacterized membrane protein